MPGLQITPPPAVRDAFRVSGPVHRLEGGDETSVRVADVVLKQVMNPTLANWTQELLAETEHDAIEVPAPLRSHQGEWVVDGWVATKFVPELRSGLGRWAEVADAGREFHASIAGRAGGIDPVLARTDRWAEADRFVWEELDLELSGEAGELIERLRAQANPGGLPAQVIHGDLTGNVFFDADDQPVILDFSPLVRPPTYAIAIVAADALLWHSADPAVLAATSVAADALARAILFRLVSEQLAVAPRHGARLDDHRRVLNLLGW